VPHVGGEDGDDGKFTGRCCLTAQGPQSINRS
jgi:hypothetical protein